MSEVPLWATVLATVASAGVSVIVTSWHHRHAWKLAASHEMTEAGTAFAQPVAACLATVQAIAQDAVGLVGDPSRRDQLLDQAYEEIDRAVAAMPRVELAFGAVTLPTQLAAALVGHLQTLMGSVEHYFGSTSDQIEISRAALEFVTTGLSNGVRGRQRFIDAVGSARHPGWRRMPVPAQDIGGPYGGSVGGVSARTARRLYSGVRVRVHEAFVDETTKAWFVNVSNQESTPITVTHVWVESGDGQRLAINDDGLPAEVRPGRQWETSLASSAVPSFREASQLAAAVRVRLGDDRTVSGRVREDIPPAGTSPRG